MMRLWFVLFLLLQELCALCIALFTFLALTLQVFIIYFPKNLSSLSYYSLNLLIQINLKGPQLIHILKAQNVMPLCK